MIPTAPPLRLGQRDLHVLDDVDHLAIGLDDPIRDAHGQAAGLDGLGEIDLVGQHLAVGADHAGEFHLTHAERVAAPLPAAPAEVEAGQLPQAIEAEAAGHDRVAGEVAGEEPQVGGDVEFGHDMALAVQAAIFRDVGDAVHHQHGRFGKLGIAGAEKFAPRAFEKGVAVEAVRIGGHALGSRVVLCCGIGCSIGMEARARVTRPCWGACMG